MNPHKHATTGDDPGKRRDARCKTKAPEGRISVCVSLVHYHTELPIEMNGAASGGSPRDIGRHSCAPHQRTIPGRHPSHSDGPPISLPVAPGVFESEHPS